MHTPCLQSAEASAGLHLPATKPHVLPVRFSHDVLSLRRGLIHPQPSHKHNVAEHGLGLWSGLLLPLGPVVSAYGGLAGILERVRVGIVMTMPEINNDVTMGVANVIPGGTIPLSSSVEGNVICISAFSRRYHRW